MKKEIRGYQFFKKGAAEEARSQLVVAKSLPRNRGDVTIYWQNYEEALLDKPTFQYMRFDESMESTMGKPSTFTVTFPGEGGSFISKFGEPISAYSLRNLTSNPEQPVVRVSTFGEGEPKEYNLTESQINLEYLLGLGPDLQVVKWYDQAGTDQSLVATTFTAPFLLSKGKMFFEGLKPAIHFNSGNRLELTSFLKPIRDNISIYNVSSYAEEQRAYLGGNSLLYNAGKIRSSIINWLPKNRLQMPFVEGPIVQNGGRGLSGEKGIFGPFPSPLKNLNLYQIPNALSAPINFGFGEAVEMNMCEFILYPEENKNIAEVTKNILDFYKIE